MNFQCLWTLYHIAIIVKVFIIERNEFKKQVLTCYEFHSSLILAILISNKPFRGQIGLDIRNWLSQQFLKAEFIRFERNTSMNKERQVWPELVNIVQFITVNNFFHAHLDPCR